MSLEEYTRTILVSHFQKFNFPLLGEPFIEICNIQNNKHGGFYIKEFINQETFYKILLHSNSKFAREFKNEIAVILDKLTNN